MREHFTKIKAQCNKYSTADMTIVLGLRKDPITGCDLQNKFKLKYSMVETVIIVPCALRLLLRPN